MITAGVGLASSAVRTWTRFYTWGLPADLRDARREEIESDLWESVVDADRQDRLALQIWWRLLGGLSDDLGWRSEQGAAPWLALRIAAMLAVVALIGLWVVQAITSPVPAAPPAPHLGVPRLIDSPPPPPPPPPCLPPGFPRDPGVTCVQ